MKTADDLVLLLREMTGSKEVYFEPPESVKMTYPAIRFKLSRVDRDFANNKAYRRMNAYEVTLIDEDADSAWFDKILQLPYCRFDRPYVADNLHHFVFTLYY